MPKRDHPFNIVSHGDAFGRGGRGGSRLVEIDLPNGKAIEVMWVDDAGTAEVRLVDESKHAYVRLVEVETDGPLRGDVHLDPFERERLR